MFLGETKVNATDAFGTKGDAFRFFQEEKDLTTETFDKADVEVSAEQCPVASCWDVVQGNGDNG